MLSGSVATLPVRYVRHPTASIPGNKDAELERMDTNVELQDPSGHRMLERSCFFSSDYRVCCLVHLGMPG